MTLLPWFISSLLFVLSPAHPALLKAIKPRLFLTIQCFDKWHGKLTPNLQLVFRRVCIPYEHTRQSSWRDLEGPCSDNFSCIHCNKLVKKIDRESKNPLQRFYQKGGKISEGARKRYQWRRGELLSLPSFPFHSRVQTKGRSLGLRRVTWMDMKLSDSSVYCAVANTSVATEIKRKDEQQANVTLR